jgi:hypothetical protein
MSFMLADTNDSQSLPRTVEKPLAAAQAFERGALLLLNGSDQFAECGADPASIAAVAASPAGTDASGFNILGKREFPAGYMQAYAIQGNKRFRARYTGSLPGADGGLFGVVRDTDALWKVDFTETVNTRLKIVGRLTNSPENLPEVLVEFLAANVQQV